MNFLRIFITCLFTILVACSNSSSSNAVTTNNDACSSENCIVYVVYSQAGLGDDGSQDLIYYGMNLSAASEKFAVEHIRPSSMESAEKSIADFFENDNAGNYSKRLLILTTGEYDSLLTANKNWKQSAKNTILILEPKKDSIDAYFWDISLYGASYLAGRTVRDMNIENNLILAANNKTKAVQDAVNGYIDGFNKKGEILYKDSSVHYIGEKDGDGFNSFQQTYSIALAMHIFQVKSFIFPVIGGSSESLYRFMREKQDSIAFFSCGMDTNKEHKSNKIPFSIIKRMDALILDFLYLWWNNEKPEKEFIATLGAPPDYRSDDLTTSEYIYITVSKGYEEWQQHFDEFLKEAQKAELKYLGKTK